MPSGGGLLRLGRKSPKSPKAPLPPLETVTPPLPSPDPPPSLPNMDTKPPTSGATSSLSLTTELSTLTVREIENSGLGLFESPGGSPIERPRARSPLFGFVRSREHSPERIDYSETPEHLRPSSRWWQHKGRRPRPWRNPSPSPHRQVATTSASPDHPVQFIVPVEQVVAYSNTATIVSRATGRSVWDGTKVIVHDVADASAQLLRLVPIPGVSEAVECLVRIWEFVGQVESNRMACLHLVERCAGILISVRTEVEIAGVSVAQTLEDPMRHLIKTFLSIELLVQKLAERPFIKRYLRREEIQLQILEAHEKLTDDLQLFGIAIQVRILKELKEHPSHSPKNALDHEIHEIPEDPLALPPPHYTPPTTPSVKTGGSRPNTGTSSSSSFVLPDIAAHHHDRFAQDCQMDNADLRRMIRDAMSANSDDRLIEILQVQKPEMAEAIRTLRRALEDPHLSNSNVRRGSHTSSVPSEKQSTRATKSSVASLLVEEDPAELHVHKEFIEEEIEALRRSSGDGKELPPWTITRWEIDRDQQIGVGFFSEVYRGQWKDAVVAIKVLSPTAPAELFLHEVHIWKTLSHRHVLPLLGASSTSSNPPWFFVSPYMRNGSVVKYLKAHPGEANHLQMIDEIAIGMDYLHTHGVLHGDLKAVNVLVDDELHCVISDFGQSKLRSEVFRLSNLNAPGGTLRWLAPELITESIAPLTWQADVYAFAISCAEILLDGELPWPKMSDPVIRHLVVDKDERPALPPNVGPPELVALIRRCWSRAAVDRPSFKDIAGQTEEMLHQQIATAEITPRPHFLPELLDEHLRANVVGNTGARSPSLEPTEPLEGGASPFDDEDPNATANESSPVSSASIKSFSSILGAFGSSSNTGSSESEARQPLPVAATTSPLNSPLERSAYTTRRRPSVDDGYESPVPRDEAAAERRNESRYRNYLQHPYHTSLNLPLWAPSAIQIGDVGYHKRPQGSFVRLFNAFDPVGTATAHGKHLPPLKYVQIGTQNEDKRSLLRRGLDFVGTIIRVTPIGRNTIATVGGAVASAVGTTTEEGAAAAAPNKRAEFSRKYDFLLRAGHKRAMLVAESTTYRYMQTLDSPRNWFAEHRDSILDSYGRKHHLEKEDLLLVIGTLDTKDYGLFVNHKHPDGTAHFNIYAERREGEPFGVWTTDTNTAQLNGPRYNEATDSAPRLSAEKVSIVRAEPAPSYTLIIARLRFKPDSDQPTSL